MRSDRCVEPASSGWSCFRRVDVIVTVHLLGMEQSDGNAVPEIRPLRQTGVLGLRWTRDMKAATHSAHKRKRGREGREKRGEKKERERKEMEMEMVKEREREAKIELYRLACRC